MDPDEDNQPDEELIGFSEDWEEGSAGLESRVSAASGVLKRVTSSATVVSIPFKKDCGFRVYAEGFADANSSFSAILASRPAKSGVTTVEIPNRSLFRQPEVCEIAQVQPYVLRTWEAEFPELGMKKTEGGPRVYRRADLEFVLRIKHLLFVEGLTLAGARRRLIDELPGAQSGNDGLDQLLGSDARERIMLVKRGLKEIAVMLSRTPSAENTAAAHSLLDLVETKPAAAARKAVKKPAPGKKKR